MSGERKVDIFIASADLLSYLFSFIFQWQHSLNWHGLFPAYDLNGNQCKYSGTTESKHTHVHTAKPFTRLIKKYAFPERFSYLPGQLF